MSSDEFEHRLAQIRDQKLAMEVRSFFVNVFLLFDDNPPPHIQTYISEILSILEAKQALVPVRVNP